MLPLSTRMSRLGMENNFLILAKAKELERQGKEILHFEIGDPDFATPQYIRDAGIAALQKGETHYTASNGTLELRTAVANYYTQRYGSQIGADRIVIAPGGKPIMLAAILACVNEGDEVIIPSPGYPIYESLIRFTGAVPVLVPLRESEDWRFDLDVLRSKITGKTKMIVINTPQNPTGGILQKKDLEEIGRLAVKHNLWIVSDEIYHRLTYADGFTSMLQIPGVQDRLVVVDGASKTYAMTGWRLGWGVMPPELNAPATKIMANTVSCPAAFTQSAALAAITDPREPEEIEKMRVEFMRRRDALVKGINSLPGWSARSPQGAFYLMANISKLGMDDLALGDFLMEKAGVAATPGSFFGEHGRGYMRFAYTNSVENIERAVERIREAMNQLQ